MVFIALFVVVVIVMLIVAGGVAIAASGSDRRKEHEDAEHLRRVHQVTQELQARINERRLPLYTGVLPLILKSKEVPLLCAAAVLAEERAVRTYDGTTVRWHKGVSSTSGTTQSHGVLKPIDSGQLVLTDKRLVFVGALRTTSTDLTKVLRAEVLGDSLTINREGKGKAETYITENPLTYSIIMNVLANTPRTEITNDALLLQK